MPPAPSPPPPRRHLPYRIVLAAAALYFVAGGVLALWFPANGLDLYVSYVAGTSVRHHESPYERAAYLRAWERLDPPPSVADAREFPFGYPPAWIPACVALSLLPWGAALALWKLLSTVCLAAAVMTTFRLLRDGALDARDRYAVGCFALALSPTITVLAVGQTSLFVLCMLVAAGRCLQQGRVVLCGLALALALIKPQLASAFVLFLLLRGELAALGVAAGVTVALTALGLSLAHTDLPTYLAAVTTYADVNVPTSHVAVGIASLLAHLTDLGGTGATAIGAAVGVALIAGVAVARRAQDRRELMVDGLPFLLYVAPLCFRCHAYDLVSLIPLFAWSRTRAMPKPLRHAIGALCLLLIVPRAALRVVYDGVAGGVLAPHVYQVMEYSFRSWVLVLLLPPVLLASLYAPSGIVGSTSSASCDNDSCHPR